MIEFLQDEVRAFEDGFINGQRINFRRVKYIPFADLAEKDRNYQYGPEVEPRIAYIADRDNHCIRRLEVSKRNVDTFAGQCGFPGFKDGP